jgi:hypothetical protein
VSSCGTEFGHESPPQPGGVVHLAPPATNNRVGYVLRRLYSTFAGGAPGIALLLMRLVVGAVVLWRAGPGLWSGPPLDIVASAALALAALLLIAGLWTPVAGAVVAVVAISEILSTGELLNGRLLAATIGCALTMLGPGRLSVDARLFGWKRIDAPVRRNSSSVG